MIGGDLVGPAVVAAVVSGIVTTIGFLINRSTTLETHKEKLAADQSLAERRFEFEKELAERKIRLDMQAQDRRRRQELAEELIAGFHEVADIMRSVRDGHVDPNEQEARNREPNESSEQTRILDSIFVFNQRYNNQRDTVARLRSKKYRAIAWFGSDILRPFRTLDSSIKKLFIACELLGNFTPPYDNYDRDKINEYRNQIYGSGEEIDKVAVDLSDAVKLIEAVCRPVLEDVG